MRLILLAVAAIAAPAAAQSGTVVYRGAQVWTGERFASRTVATRDGRFVVVPRLLRGVEVRDVSGRFLTPAYANAHCHLTSPTRVSSDGFLRDGVFYVWNPNTIVLTPEDKAFFGTPDTIDLKIAQGGITEPRGHPEPLYTDILAKYVYKGRDKSWFLSNAFHYGRTPAEIRATLDTLKAQQADFVKAYLLHSEEYARRVADPQSEGARGLNPANMPLLVREARRRGLAVAVHVETAADLLVAARAGAAVAAHLPGYGGDTSAAMRVRPDQALAVARTGIRITPTFSVGAGRVDDKATPEQQKLAVAAVAVQQRDNMLALKRVGARFLMGTDGRGPVFDEAERWVAIGAMTPVEAARVVFATGPYLFPERRVGCLKVGCEADFLVLSADPTRDIRHLRTIEQRYKAGKLLTPSAAPS